MTGSPTLEWRLSPGLTPYPEAVTAMEAHVAAIVAHEKPELAWMLEHPPLYTAGTSAKPGDLKDAARLPVYETGRGGQYTYHGPGQRVIYAMADLRARGRDLRRHVWNLEEWVIRVLADFGVAGERREGRVGIWVATPRGEEKIAAIGVRVRKWVTYHGLALNVEPDLSHFSGIVPCGLPQFGVASLRQLGIAASMPAIDAAFKKRADLVFTEAFPNARL